MKDIIIRQARLEEAEKLAEIEAICFPKAEAAELKSFCERLESFGDCFFVAEKQGEIIGFINGMVTDEETIADVMFEDATLHKVDGMWQRYFTCCPDEFTREEKKAYLNTIKGVALGSDAFFPFSDNIERAFRSGVSFVAQPGGSVRDDLVIDACNNFGMVMAFTGMRLFHH